MKFNCGGTYAEVRPEQWHEWFAWRPVKVGPDDCRWLETVRRRGVFHQRVDDWWWTWEYEARPEARRE